MKEKGKPPHIGRCQQGHCTISETATAAPAQRTSGLLTTPLEIQEKQGHRERQSFKHVLLQ